MIKQYALLLSLLVSCCYLATAQPIQTYWPGLGATYLGPQVQPTALRMADCERPDNTVQAGTEGSFELDLSGGFDASATLLSNNSTPRAAVSIALDSLLIYDAIPTITLSGYDTVRYEVCNAAAECQERTLVIGAGRPGMRTNLTEVVTPGASAELVYPVPESDLFCGSIMNIGTYDALDRRTIGFTSGSVSNSVLYNAARAPGIDEFEVIVCNVFGTCDTLQYAVTIPGATISLPFCSDFSEAGPKPDPSLWLEDDVFINDAFGANVPSIGVASFDGLAEGGQPYGEGFGILDQLTSTFIDLSVTFTPVFLKYDLQLGGRGQAPERRDLFVVEGRNQLGNWVLLKEHEGSRISISDTTFKFNSILIDDIDLLHSKFQVRFRTRGNRAGGFDNWNLDYVRVEEGDADRAFADIALTKRPESLLRPYSAMPYSQFAGRAQEFVDPTLNIGLFNHFATTNNITSSQLEVRDANGTVLLNTALLGASQLNLNPGATNAINPIAPTPFSNLIAALNASTSEAVRKLTTSYVLDIDNDQIQIDCALNNDAATSTTTITDFFAYDDGSAESGLLPGGSGDRIVVRYEAVVQDTLRGLRFAFPRLSDAEATRQLINLQVYIGGLDDEPEYQEILVRPYFPASVGDSLNALTTYSLVDGLGEPTTLIIPPGEFFVGWQQASDDGNPVPVGFDLNYNSASQIFTDYGIGWVPFTDIVPDLNGSLMIHPVFSDEVLQNSSGVRDLVDADVQIFPNPTSGAVSLRTSEPALLSGTYEVLDLLGRQVQMGQSEERLQLDVLPGVYTLLLYTSDRKSRISKRIVVAK